MRQVVRTPAATSLRTSGTPMNPVPPSTSALLSGRSAREPGLSGVFSEE
jgi:hypothetical protein